MPRRKQQRKVNIYIAAMKSALIAVSITIAAIMIFAFIVKENDLQDADINVFNEIIKMHGIGLSAVFAIKKLTEKQILAALLSSVFYVLICFISFSMIRNSSPDISVIVVDTLFAAGIGAAIGLLFSKICFVHKNAKNT